MIPAPLLYGAAALFGYAELKRRRKHAKRGRATVARVATTRQRNCVGIPRARNCGTNRRCNCRSH